MCRSRRFPARIYLQLPIEESLIARRMDPTTVVVGTDLTMAGSVVSSNNNYFGAYG